MIDAWLVYDVLSGAVREVWRIDPASATTNLKARLGNSCAVTKVSVHESAVGRLAGMKIAKGKLIDAALTGL